MCTPQIVTVALKRKIAAHAAAFREVTTSPFGPADEIGMLNLIDSESRDKIMSRADASKIFDLSVDNFVGMPSWTAAGDPNYQIWMTHTPGGETVWNSMKVDDATNALVGYSGDAVSMYTHTGTHVDTLNHFGYRGKIFNNFSAEKNLGSRGWDVCGAETHPPTIARGILLDIPALLDIAVLPPSYGVGADDLKNCLQKQGTALLPGDVVMVRTGQMQAHWPSVETYMPNPPGLTREGAAFLCEAGAITVGTDTASFEQLPSTEPGNFLPVHCYMLAEAGVPIMEIVFLDELASEKLYEFAFFGACIRLRGATGAPMRPVAMPLRP